MLIRSPLLSGVAAVATAAGAAALSLPVAATAPPTDATTADSPDAAVAERIVVHGLDSAAQITFLGEQFDAGATLVPDAADHEADQNGRVYLSTEQLDVLSAPQIVLMQSDLVEGDSDAVDQMTDTPLWALLPAVQDDNVHIVDRLGYPGTEGHTRAIGDLVTLLTETTTNTTPGGSTEATTS